MLRFHHVFYFLLALSGLCAFVIPARIGDAARGNFQVLFAPISWPARTVAGAFSRSISPQRERDDASRSSDSIIRENQELKTLVASLQGQVATLAQEESQRETLGDVRKLCRPSRVLGSSGDPALRQCLQIAAGTRAGCQRGTPVLFAGAGGGGIAGVIDRAQLGGSLVQLTTDSDFRVPVAIGRFTTDAGGHPQFAMLDTPTVLAQGDGNGALWIRNLSWQQSQSAGVQSGDWIVLRDEDWPAALQQYRIGRIESIAPWAKSPGFAEIKVRPPVDLMGLREVLVMTGK